MAAQRRLNLLVTTLLPSMTNPFESSRLIIGRANQHIAELKTLISLLPSAYTATVEINPNGGNEVVKHDLRNRNKLISDAALMLGDAIHNLHCALDHAWMATLTRLSPNSITKQTKFPIFPRKDKVEAALRGIKVDITAPTLFEAIVDKIQPYHGGNDSIWDVHRLDMDDKHVLLLPIIELASLGSIQVENERGERESGFTWVTAQKPPYYVPIPLGWHFKEKGEVAITIAFEEGTPSHGTDVVDMLSMFSIQVLGVVQSLENVILIELARRANIGA